MANAPQTPHGGNHHSNWQAFTKYSGYATVAIITILILMAIFLT